MSGVLTVSVDVSSEDVASGRWNALLLDGAYLLHKFHSAQTLRSLTGEHTRKQSGPGSRGRGGFGGRGRGRGGIFGHGGRGGGGGRPRGDDDQPQADDENDDDADADAAASELPGGEEEGAASGTVASQSRRTAQSSSDSSLPLEAQALYSVLLDAPQSVHTDLMLRLTSVWRQELASFSIHHSSFAALFDKRLPLMKVTSPTHTNAQSADRHSPHATAPHISNLLYSVLSRFRRCSLSLTR
jgi:hypothetical protein